MERLTKRIDGGIERVCRHYPEGEKMCYGCVKRTACNADLFDRLAYYEDMEEQGRLVVLPCGADAELARDGHIFKADHWNHTLTAFRENPATRSGKQGALFSIENAEQALKGGAK